MTQRRPFSWRRLDIGDIVVMLDSSAPFADGSVVWEVAGVEAVPAAPHGGICLLSAAAAAPVPYVLDGNGRVSTTIPALGNCPRIAPLSLQTDQYMLGQWRFRTWFQNVDGPPAVDDLSVRAYSGSIPRWTTSNLVGELNAMMQIADEADPALAPARGANEAAASSYPGPGAWDRAESTELWSYYNKAPIAFDLVNRGSVTLGTNGTFAWMMRFAGWIYQLAAVPMGQSPKTIQKAGAQIMVPSWVERDDVVCVQLSSRQPHLNP